MLRVALFTPYVLRCNTAGTTGIEPVSLALQASAKTTSATFPYFSSPGQIRTDDFPLVRRALLPLSYGTIWFGVKDFNLRLPDSLSGYSSLMRLLFAVFNTIAFPVCII